MKKVILLIGVMVLIVALSGCVQQPNSEELQPTDSPPNTSTNLQTQLDELEEELAEKDEIISKYNEQCGELEQEVPEGTIVCGSYGERYNENNECWKEALNGCIKNAVYKWGETKQYAQWMCSDEWDFKVLGYFEDEAYERKLCKFLRIYKRVRQIDGLVLRESKQECTIMTANAWSCGEEYDVINR